MKYSTESAAKRAATLLGIPDRWNVIEFYLIDAFFGGWRHGSRGLCCVCNEPNTDHFVSNGVLRPRCLKCAMESTLQEAAE